MRKIVVPGMCYRCKSRVVKPHCPGKRCYWVRCTACEAVSAYSGGRRRVFGGGETPGKETAAS